MKKYSIIFAACLIALCMVSQVASQTARARGFSVVGPGGGGSMFNPAISPHDPNEVLVRCDMTGAYITHDAGRSWRIFDLRDAVRFFAFDALRPRVIYTGTGSALWRSTDDGKSWGSFWPKPSTVDGVRMNQDHADETILSDANPLGVIVAMAIDPADSRILTVAAVKDETAALYTSNDDGQNWEKEAALPEVPQGRNEARFQEKIWIDPHSTASDRDIYAAGEHGVMVRHLGKWQNRPAPAGIDFADVSAGFSSPHGVRFYAASEAGVFVSNDGAATWTEASLPGKGARTRAIAASLNHPEIAYVSYKYLQLEGKTWLGVAKTSDGGATWTLVWKDEYGMDLIFPDAPNIHEAWLEALGTEWGDNPRGLAVSAQDPNVAYSTDDRTMKTTDGGANWYAVYSRKVQGADWTSTGLDVTTNYGYLFDPIDIHRRFIPTTDIGLFRSEDDGRSWARSVAGVPQDWQLTTYWVAFDPGVRGKMWGVMSGTHDLPRPKMWRSTDTATYRGGVCVSLDGGRTWKKSNQGMPETAPTHILLDSSSPVGKRVLWVAAMGRGVYKSTDDGVTWTLKNKGIAQNQPLAWRLARAADGTLYLVVARYSWDGSIGTSGDGAIYKSTDGAESWTPVNLPAGTNGPNGLAIDPQNPQRLYLAAWGRAVGMHGMGGGIYLSNDGGSTWKTVFDRDQHVFDVTIEPTDANILYAVGFESSAWRSDDRGEHWARIPGYDFKWGQRVSPDPMDSKMIYIATFGGGVWHGPSAGAKGHADIATPALQPGH